MEEQLQELTNNKEDGSKIFKILKASFWMGIGATITAITALILGSVAVHKTVGLHYYLNPDHTAVWGDTTIWWNKQISPNKTDLYFSPNKDHDEDIKWDGTYTAGYFTN